MNDFYNMAIMVIYPNGKVEIKKIEDKIFHMTYFSDLYNDNTYFKEFMNKSNSNYFKDNNLFTYSLDLELAKNGVIAIHNLNIREIKEKPNFFKKHTPNFIFTMPNELTYEQKEAMKEIIFQNDLYESLFLSYNVNDFISIEYDEIIDLLHQKKY